MYASGILYVEGAYENMYNKCLMTVFNGLEIHGLVKFWNTSILPGALVSYTALIQVTGI